MNKLKLILAGLMCLGLTACGSMMHRPSSPPTLDRVDHMELRVSPTALRLVGRSAADGIGFALYLYEQGGTALPGMVRQGKFQFAVYEQRADALSGAAAPFYTWEYTAQQMRQFFAPGQYGLGCYQATLNWAPLIPRTATVTLVARYVDPKGNVVTCEPADVETTEK